MCGGSIIISPPVSPISPGPSNFLLGSQLVDSLGSPIRASKPTTLLGVVLDPGWSGRTFNIPDCPAKHSVGCLKDWYIRNIRPAALPSAVQITHTDGSVVPDSMPFWQLAAGETSFTVTVSYSAPDPGPSKQTVTLYVQHESNGVVCSVELDALSKLIELKVSSFEMMGIGDSTAALDHHVGLSFDGRMLDCEHTIEQCGLRTGDRVVLTERVSPPSTQRGSRTPSPAHDDPNYTTIAGIWLEDQQHQPKPQRAAKHPKRQESELARLNSSYRTKMCRAGAAHCKFASACWFAHSPEELRKPGDPLPDHCPGVNKLEKYAKRHN